MNLHFDSDRLRSACGGACSALALLAGLASGAIAQEPGTPAVPMGTDSVAVAAPSDSASNRAADFPNTPMVVQNRMIKLIGKQNVMRSGPGDSFSIVGVYREGATFTVIAKSDDWYNVRLSDAETGWVHASLCKEYDDLSNLQFRPNPKLYVRTGSFALTGYGGAYAFDRKSNSLVLGGRLAYYVFDRLQAEAGVSWTHVQRPAEIVESLFGLTLEAEDFHMLFYNLNATWEILPGRQMVPYITGGVGQTIMQGETEASYNMGAGVALFLAKKTAMRWEVRDYRFETGPKGSRVTNDNIEFTLGTTILF